MRALEIKGHDGWFCQALIKKYVCKERISNEKIK